MKDNWFKEVSKRCPWNNKALCKAFTDVRPHIINNNCEKSNCAPFFMAATIISVYRDNDKREG